MQDNNPKQKATLLLKNGNPRGDLNAVKKCNALNRRGERCGCPAMKGKKKCRLHGGKSTGPRTPQGLQNSRTARLKHGGYSKEFIEKKQEINAMSRLVEIMAKPGVSHPLALDVLKDSLLKGEHFDDGKSFPEDVDFKNLAFEDQLKIYKKLLSLLGRGTKSLAKFGAKVER